MSAKLSVSEKRVFLVELVQDRCEDGGAGDLGDGETALVVHHLDEGRSPIRRDRQRSTKTHKKTNVNVLWKLLYFFMFYIKVVSIFDCTTIHNKSYLKSYFVSL